MSENVAVVNHLNGHGLIPMAGSANILSGMVVHLTVISNAVKSATIVNMIDGTMSLNKTITTGDSNTQP